MEVSTVTCFAIALLIVGGAMYAVTKTIEKMFYIDNTFLSFLSFIGALMMEIAIILGAIELVVIIAAAVKVISVAL